MDTAQILLLSVVIVLTLLLLFLGIQVFFILKEFRNTVSKINKVLDDAGVISENVSKPFSNLSNVLAGVKTGMSILSIFTKKKHARSKEADDEQSS